MQPAVCALAALAILPAAASAQCQLQKHLPDPAYNGFGIYTALSDNYGAVASDSEGDSPATAFVLYRRAGNTLTHVGPLLPSEGVNPSTTRYGHGIAMHGNTIVTTDYMANNFAGRVYTFVDTGTAFAQQATLNPPAGVQAFGTAVATDGARLVVTTSWTHPNGGPGGNAFVYTRTPTGWAHVQSNLNPSMMDGPEFGMSVSLQGDTLAIGAPDQFDPGFYGSVFVYIWNGTQYELHSQVLPPAEIFPPNGYGMGVLVHNDLLFVGAPDRPFSGQVYTYRRNGNNYDYVETINPGTYNNEFGRRLAFLPETSTLIVSAEGDMTSGASAGAVYPYQISPQGNATPLPPIYPNDAAEGQRFGACVAASNGLLLIGARSDGDGSAYVFTPTGPCAPACPGDQCGPQDYNGDGDSGTDQDIEAFFACLGGTCCETCFCQGSDFNGDGDIGTDQDIEAFFRVLGGNPC
ncbi:MAG TPA: hypothetical protein VD997_11140 [Phycisphaerales bacterium]|nr:hypothetical protein [Phycisphaerales bacterium]